METVKITCMAISLINTVNNLELIGGQCFCFCYQPAAINNSNWSQKVLCYNSQFTQNCFLSKMEWTTYHVCVTLASYTQNCIVRYMYKVMPSVICSQIRHAWAFVLINFCTLHCHCQCLLTTIPCQCQTITIWQSAKLKIRSSHWGPQRIQ